MHNANRGRRQDVKRHARETRERNPLSSSCARARVCMRGGPRALENGGVCGGKRRKGGMQSNARCLGVKTARPAAEAALSPQEEVTGMLTPCKLANLLGRGKHLLKSIERQVKPPNPQAP